MATFASLITADDLSLNIYEPEWRTGTEIRPPDQMVFRDSSHDLNIVIEEELIRMRPHVDRINLVLAFVINPDIQNILREYITLEEIFVILF